MRTPEERDEAVDRPLVQPAEVSETLRNYLAMTRARDLRPPQLPTGWGQQSGEGSTS